MGRISTATAIVLLFAGDAKAIECQADMQRGHDYWAWRLIDGRKCWYVGAPGLDKSLLRWPTQSNDETDQSSRGKAEAPLDELKVRQTRVAPKLVPVPVDSVLPSERTFEERWRLR